MKRLIHTWLLLVAFTSPSYAMIDAYQFDTPAQDQRFFELTNELRCPQCQNQTIGDSDATIAQDLRQEVHRLLVKENASDEVIIDFMLDRYGDFILYMPRFEGVNLILWLAPVLLLLIGLAVLFVLVNKHRRTVPESNDSTMDNALNSEQGEQR